MKKIGGMICLAVVLMACDNSAKVNINADSLKEKIDTSLEKFGDSVKAKGGRVVETIKDKLDNLDKKADSVKIDTGR